MKRCHGMYQGVGADRFDDKYLKRNVLPGVLDDQGKIPTVTEFRRACAEARAKGWEVFPICDNPGPDGRCAGHEDDQPARRGEKG